MIELNKNIDQLEDYLKSKSWLGPQEKIESVEVPGEGNMNFTLRVKSKTGSFIVKQSRSYVEKYPQVAAPADRCKREAEFYKIIRSNEELKRMTPAILGFDEANNIMLMADLGVASDYTYLYKSGHHINILELQEIMGFAANLHTNFKLNNAPFVIHNRSMRKLNHEHMFVYPYMENNGINLDEITPGLASLAQVYKKDKALLSTIQNLGERYLADGDTLLHGDYFPGSWLKTKDGIRIIDPEFCFYGYPEFEIGVSLAHLIMASQVQETIDQLIPMYQEMAPLDAQLTKQCAGAEIFRRLLGLAQLPLDLNAEAKGELLATANEYLK